MRANNRGGWITSVRKKAKRQRAKRVFAKIKNSSVAKIDDCQIDKREHSTAMSLVRSGLVFVDFCIYSPSGFLTGSCKDESVALMLAGSSSKVKKRYRV